ncbi:uncharacterized protein LOC131688320 [Topomyia yanbarensis]|uniref:uncharacterized protein LOC131688320 n=1 Tax=Topomyia yanbarensis TaxID=2498891 RepID=UPI00273AA195|nr:uncharacterized protein LOC131688320 [Topomyia yanbarensis]
MVSTGRMLYIAIVVVGTIGIAGSTEQTPEETDIQGRQLSADSYWYNDVYYWWPWFSDLATVVMIKLKIAVGLAAIYAFGDGYYWTKAKTAPPDVGYWGEQSWDHVKHHPWSFFKGWGRRKRDLSEDYAGSMSLDRHKFVEFVFEAFEVHDEDCRRRTVCELDFELSNNPKMKSKLKGYKLDLFRKYRGELPRRKEDCERLYSSCKMLRQEEDVHFYSGDEGKLMENAN